MSLVYVHILCALYLLVGGVSSPSSAVVGGLEVRDMEVVTTAAIAPICIVSNSYSE